MQTGILKWEGFDYQSASINDLPIHIPIKMETQLLQIVTVIFIQKELILEQLKILKKKKKLDFIK